CFLPRLRVAPGHFLSRLHGQSVNMPPLSLAGEGQDCLVVCVTIRCALPRSAGEGQGGGTCIARTAAVRFSPCARSSNRSPCSSSAVSCCVRACTCAAKAQHTPPFATARGASRNRSFPFRLRPD